MGFVGHALKNMIPSTLYPLNAWQPKKTNGGELNKAVVKLVYITWEKLQPC